MVVQYYTPNMQLNILFYLFLSNKNFLFSEYVKNINAIYKYNCSRKAEFIKKGLGKNNLILCNIES